LTVPTRLSLPFLSSRASSTTPSKQSWTRDVICGGKAVELCEAHRLVPDSRALAVSVLNSLNPASEPYSIIMGVTESMITHFQPGRSSVRACENVMFTSLGSALIEYVPSTPLDPMLLNTARRPSLIHPFTSHPSLADTTRQVVWTL
jgi:hypothetical protein